MGHGGGQACLLQPTHTRRLLPVLPLPCVPLPQCEVLPPALLPAQDQLLPWLPEVAAVPCDARSPNGDCNGTGLGMRKRMGTGTRMG